MKSSRTHRQDLMDTMAAGRDEICYFMVTAVSIKAQWKVRLLPLASHCSVMTSCLVITLHSEALSPASVSSSQQSLMDNAENGRMGGRELSHS